MRCNVSNEHIILMPTGACTVAELEVLLDIVGEAATRLKKRLDSDLIYGQRMDDDGRKFSGLHETVFPLCSKTRSIFDQLRNTSSERASRQRVDSGAASQFAGRPDGRITGMDMRDLLLLLPFLLFDNFDMLQDTVADHNDLHGTSYVSPAQEIINWVLVLLEWYRLYR